MHPQQSTPGIIADDQRLGGGHALIERIGPGQGLVGRLGRGPGPEFGSGLWRPGRGWPLSGLNGNGGVSGLARAGAQGARKTAKGRGRGAGSRDGGTAAAAALVSESSASHEPRLCHAGQDPGNAGHRESAAQAMLKQSQR